jgi:hypothetical protein
VCDGKNIQGDPGVKGVIVPNGNNLTDVVGEGVFWIHLAQEVDMLSVLMNTNINPQSSENKGLFCLSERL